METRGNPVDERPKSRPAIARRSCDQCRARKVGCDRGSPCSNCISARVNCTHSAVASNTTGTKQRVLISAQYEQKINDIAKGIDGIKLLLEGRTVSPEATQSDSGSTWNLNQSESANTLIEYQPISATGIEPLWDQSAFIISFIKAVVDVKGSQDVEPQTYEVTSSLRKLLSVLEGPVAARALAVPVSRIAKYQATPRMPPLEAVVAILRWAKEHETFFRIAWISRILPLETFTDICRRVYFAVDDYTEIDLILANGYLTHVFSEHVIVSGLQDYSEHCRMCRDNLEKALSRLPLLLPASMEVIAALALGAFNAIENSKATMAWTFVSAAADLCQTLGYHRLHLSKGNDLIQQAAQGRLFWTVHRMEKSLALRLGRASNIRDAEITVLPDADAPRFARVSKIQGQVYDQLYSPVGLARPEAERGRFAEALALELRESINETRDEVFDATNHPSDGTNDPMRVVYLQCDLVCQSSLLALILRAVPPAPGSLSGVSDECVAVARDVLDLHQQCMRGVRGSKGEVFMVIKYINWAILHLPFVPFSILFTRAVQFLDVDDLARLEGFAASLRPKETSQGSITHPHRLYEVLCQAARLYIDSSKLPTSIDPTPTYNLPESLGDIDFSQFGMEAGAAANDVGLSGWYYGNQQIMSLLDEDMIF